VFVVELSDGVFEAMQVQNAAEARSMPPSTDGTLPGSALPW
jgi:hypothetical protein